MSLFEKIKQDRINAMKNKDAIAKGVLSTLMGELQTLSKNFGQSEPTDDQVIKKVKSYIANSESNLELLGEQKSVDLYAKGLDIRSEIILLSAYVPKQLDDESLRATIKNLIAELGVKGKQAIGPVMKTLKDRHSGCFDGQRASEIVREETA